MRQTLKVSALWKITAGQTLSDCEYGEGFESMIKPLKWEGQAPTEDLVSDMEMGKTRCELTSETKHQV